MYEDMTVGTLADELIDFVRKMVKDQAYQ